MAISRKRVLLNTTAKAFMLHVTADDGTVLYKTGQTSLMVLDVSNGFSFTIPAGTESITIGLDDSWYDWNAETGEGLFDATFALYFREKRL
ncbi:MAG: hypothetical protein LUF89_00620 [Ruminococcus sp.]|nr:hypothetical protein [Ruminococcus sp.]